MSIPVKSSSQTCESMVCIRAFTITPSMTTPGHKNNNKTQRDAPCVGRPGQGGREGGRESKFLHGKKT